MARTFTARFDSECGHCFLDICEGDEAGWRDGEVVHENCLEDEEDEPSSPIVTAAPAASPAAMTATASVTNEIEDQMTDVATEATAPAPAEQDWSQSDANVTYPSFPDNPHNHAFTISMDGRGPMIVVRGNTPQEVNQRFQELQDAGTTTIAAAVYSHMKAEMAVAQGLGPVSAVPAPQGPPVPPPMPQAPQAQYPAGPPALPQGQAPAAWQNAGAPAAPVGPQNAEYKNAGWYRLDVPFPKKGQFDAVCAQYQLRKGRPAEGGQFSFNNKGEKNWYVAPEVAGAFGQFSPVPA